MASRAKKSFRTRKGNITAEGRRKHGSKTAGEKKDSFPIDDRESALSALKLRGHAHTKRGRLNIINRARKYAPQAAKEAYRRDKDNNKI